MKRHKYNATHLLLAILVFILVFRTISLSIVDAREISFLSSAPTIDCGGKLYKSIIFDEMSKPERDMLNSTLKIPNEVVDLVESSLKNKKYTETCLLVPLQPNSYEVKAGTEYTGYQNLKYKDYILKQCEASSVPVAVTHDTWRVIQNASIKGICVAGIGLMTTGISSAVGLVYSLLTAGINVDSGVVAATTQITLLVSCPHSKTTKVTYVQQGGTGEWMFGISVEEAPYHFHYQWLIPGKDPVPMGATQTVVAHTQHYFNSDEGAYYAHTTGGAKEEIDHFIHEYNGNIIKFSACK